jgi:tyrosyl-tRNA synthetase
VVKSSLDNIGSLKVKFGTDPTGPELHLGHAVPLRLLELFRRTGHTIDIVFGDFTAGIGDPSDRISDRPILSKEQIARNVETFSEQVAPFVDTKSPNVRLHRNSDWISKLTLADFFGVLTDVRLSDATQRDDFRYRSRTGDSVRMSEVLYATLMGVDSIHLGSDLEIGGTDQLLNFMQARKLMFAKGLDPEMILVTPMIQGTDGSGSKMGKSNGNYIPVLAPSDETYGKVMSIPDKLILPYMKAFAPVHEKDAGWLESLVYNNPHRAKKDLARYITSLSTGEEGASEASDRFHRRFYI